MSSLLFCLWILVAFFALYRLVTFLLKKPTGIGEWSPDQALLSWVDVSEKSITIHNIRNCVYRTEKDYDVHYYDKTFSLEDIRGVDFIVEPFMKLKGVAHTFVSFLFSDGSYVAVSVEIRKRKGEHFSATKGFFKHFELMYVFADERDIIAMRACYRRDQVYLYHINTTQEKAQQMFLSMAARANKLKEKPEFYDTISNTCTTNIADHANSVTPNRVPMNHKVFAPSFSDELAYDIGLIDNSLPFAETKKRALINTRADAALSNPQFSKLIRNW